MKTEYKRKAAQMLVEEFETPEPGKDGWTPWQNPIMKGYRMRCCDCKLVHEVEFRVGRVTYRNGDEWHGDEVSPEEYRVQLRVKRS